MRSFNSLSSLAAVLAASFLIGCGGDSAPETAEHANAPGAGTGAAQPPSDVALTGKIIEVTMHTDEKGNYFEPANIEAHAGDIVRFKLVTGVHNVHFVADSNPGAKWLPPMSTFLQLPGQTFDVKLTFGEGDYYYQCDPHALLGMVGRIKVEDED
jgi:plastocyanin